VQSSSWEARVGLLLVPIAVTILVGGYFLGRGKFNSFLFFNTTLFSKNFKMLIRTFFKIKLFLVAISEIPLRWSRFDNYNQCSIKKRFK